MKSEDIKRIVYCGLFLSLGLILPSLTGNIKEIGDSLLPMHLPVMLCGIICGPFYGLGIGLVLPFARSLLTGGMPPVFPNAVWMALELATYGLVIGILYAIGKRHSKLYTLFCLGCAMIAGRVVWGVSKALLLIGRSTFTMKAFVLGGFVDALLGIVLQLILIPLIIDAYERIKQK